MSSIRKVEWVKLGQRRYRAAETRGFTLVELMAVVAIVSTLAVIGIMLVRKQIYSSRAVESNAMIQSIRAAQERWYAETRSYYDVSTSMDAWYPMKTPGKDKYAWDAPNGNDYTAWRILNPTASGPVQFGYTTKAGAPGVKPPLLTIADPPTWSVPTQPWYVIQSKGDTDGDGVPAMLAASSFTPEIYYDNSGE